MKQDYITDINGANILIEDVQHTGRVMFGANLRELRKEKELSQTQLSKMANVERANIARIENGKFNLSIGIMIKLAAALGKDIEIKFVDRS